MKRYKVTMMVPQEHFIEASDVQAAHNQVSTMLAAYGIVSFSFAFPQET